MSIKITTYYLILLNYAYKRDDMTAAIRKKTKA